MSYIPAELTLTEPSLGNVFNINANDKGALIQTTSNTSNMTITTSDVDPLNALRLDAPITNLITDNLNIQGKTSGSSYTLPTVQPIDNSVIQFMANGSSSFVPNGGGGAVNAVLNTAYPTSATAGSVLIMTGGDAVSSSPTDAIIVDAGITTITGGVNIVGGTSANNIYKDPFNQLRVNGENNVYLNSSGGSTFIGSDGGYISLNAPNNNIELLGSGTVNIKTTNGLRIGNDNLAQIYRYASDLEVNSAGGILRMYSNGNTVITATPNSNILLVTPDSGTAILNNLKLQSLANSNNYKLPTPDTQPLQNQIITFNSDGSSQFSNQSAPLTSSIFNYRASVPTYAIPPAGRIQWEDPVQILPNTYIRVSHLNDDGQDIDALLSLLNPNDTIIIQDKNNSNNFQKWLLLNAPVVIPNSYIQYNVALQSTGGVYQFINSQQLVLITSTESSILALQNQVQTNTFNITNLENTRIINATSPSIPIAGSVLYMNGLDSLSAIPSNIFRVNEEDVIIYDNKVLSFIDTITNTTATIQETVDGEFIILNGKSVIITVETPSDQIVMRTNNGFTQILNSATSKNAFIGVEADNAFTFTSDYNIKLRADNGVNISRSNPLGASANIGMDNSNKLNIQNGNGIGLIDTGNDITLVAGASKNVILSGNKYPNSQCSANGDVIRFNTDGTSAFSSQVTTNTSSIASNTSSITTLQQRTTTIYNIVGLTGVGAGSQNVFTNGSALTLSLLANSIYSIEYAIFYNTTQLGGGLGFSFTTTATTPFDFNFDIQYGTGSGNTTNFNIRAFNGAVVGTATTATALTTLVVRIKGLVSTSLAQTIALNCNRAVGAGSINILSATGIMTKLN